MPVTTTSVPTNRAAEQINPNILLALASIPPFLLRTLSRFPTIVPAKNGT